MPGLVCPECGAPLVAGQSHVCTVRIPRPRQANGGGTWGYDSQITRVVTR